MQCQNHQEPYILSNLEIQKLSKQLNYRDKIAIIQYCDWPSELTLQQKIVLNYVLKTKNIKKRILGTYSYINNYVIYLMIVEKLNEL
jgi:hypothetical protein